MFNAVTQKLNLIFIAIQFLFLSIERKFLLFQKWNQIKNLMADKMSIWKAIMLRAQIINLDRKRLCDYRTAWDQYRTK